MSLRLISLSQVVPRSQIGLIASSLSVSIERMLSQGSHIATNRVWIFYGGMVMISQCPMLMAVTLIQIIIGHFNSTFALVTIDREAIIYVTDYARVAVSQDFVV